VVALHSPPQTSAMSVLRAVPMELTPLRVLLVEDRPADTELLLHLLRAAGFEPDWRRVETESDYLANLDSRLDVILADYALPEFSGLEALRLMLERDLSIPFILITGTAGEEAAVSALQQGADDYLLKDRLARLGQAIRRALEQHALREQKRRAERDLWDTEQRLLNQERAARVEAEASVRMRDEFVAIASHELRTPVTTIKSTAQLLLLKLDRGPVEPGQLTGRLRTINAMSDRLDVLIADLLDVTRLRTGQLRLRPRQLDLAQLAGQVVNEERVRLGAHYPLTLKILGELPSIIADPFRIQQVLSNVLQNAIKYSPVGGDVEMCVRAEDLGVMVSVSDQGIGLPPGTAESIFEPFGRASNAQRQQLPGMGLGLYVASQIIGQHGGRIWAVSPGENKGTTVTVWLPAFRTPAPGLFV
jgi:signal transduction histidine kinase